MNRTSLKPAVASALCLFAAACSSTPEAVGDPAGGSHPTGNVSNATETSAGAASNPPLDAACDTAFDALLARVAKCGPGSTMNLVPVERSRASFKKLCGIQGSRPGTGYTAAFRTTCAEVLSTAPCADDDAVVKACWEPRGELARGLPCSADDQCKDGLCELPSGAASGSSCGVCGTPVWKQKRERCDASDKDKCEPATRCATYGGGSERSCRPVLGTPLGEGCNTEVCRFGLTCEVPGSVRCVQSAPPAAVGEACGFTDDDKLCEFGTVCNRAGVCENVPTLDEPSGKAVGAHCDSWTTESATGKCIVKDALSCN